MKKIIPIITVIILVVVIAYAQEAMRIDSEGNVGIGTNNPTEKLEVDGNIKLSGSVISEDRFMDKTGEVMPVGTILPFGGAIPPLGWKLCNGTSLENSGDYTDLYTVIGTNFGDGSIGSDGNAADGDFNVPDLRGMFIRGMDSGKGNDPDTGTRQSINGSNAGDNVGSFQTDEIKSHYHPMGRSGSSHNQAADIFRIGTSPGVNGRTRSFGGNETRPKNISLNYIIKY